MLYEVITYQRADQRHTGLDVQYTPRNHCGLSLGPSSVQEDRKKAHTQEKGPIRLWSTTSQDPPPFVIPMWTERTISRPVV